MSSGDGKITAQDRRVLVISVPRVSLESTNHLGQSRDDAATVGQSIQGHDRLLDVMRPGLHVVRELFAQLLRRRIERRNGEHLCKEVLAPIEAQCGRGNVSANERFDRILQRLEFAV